MYTAWYIDNNLFIENLEAINKTADLLQKNGLVLKVEVDVYDYLSCKIKYYENKKKAWLGQSYQMENLQMKFREQDKGRQYYVTPGMPNFLIVRPTNDM